MFNSLRRVNQKILLLMTTSQLIQMVIGYLLKEEMKVMNFGQWYLRKHMLRCMELLITLKLEKFNMLFQI